MTELLPEPLRKVVVKIRAALKKAGDDGTQGSARASVKVDLGWAELRAIYRLNAALGAARESRHAWERKASNTTQKLNQTVEQTRADFAQLDLLNNRAIVALLVDVERVIQGDEDVTELQVHETLRRVRALINRSNAQDHRRRVR